MNDLPSDCTKPTLVADQPLFETGLLLSGEADQNDIRRQLSRWVSSGRLKQLRRRLYTLAPPYQKISAHPFLLANFLMPGSHISTQSALAYYGLIPEYAGGVWEYENFLEAITDPNHKEHDEYLVGSLDRL
jgi:predicted transcriptional regulator of viral defense system